MDSTLPPGVAEEDVGARVACTPTLPPMNRKQLCLGLPCSIRPGWAVPGSGWETRGGSGCLDLAATHGYPAWVQAGSGLASQDRPRGSTHGLVIGWGAGFKPGSPPSGGVKGHRGLLPGHWLAQLSSPEASAKVLMPAPCPRRADRPVSGKKVQGLGTLYANIPLLLKSRTIWKRLF